LGCVEDERFFAPGCEFFSLVFLKAHNVTSPLVSFFFLSGVNLPKLLLAKVCLNEGEKKRRQFKSCAECRKKGQNMETTRFLVLKLPRSQPFLVRARRLATLGSGALEPFFWPAEGRFRPHSTKREKVKRRKSPDLATKLQKVRGGCAYLCFLFCALVLLFIPFISSASFCERSRQ
jgi:hypothetical protein